MAKLEKTSASLQDSLTKYESLVMANFSTDMRNAIAKNEKILEDHLAWCGSFGFYAAGLVALFELLVIALYFYIVDYKSRKRKYLKEIQEDKEIEKEIPQDPKDKLVEKVSKEDSRAEPNSIGFGRKEGDIVAASGKKRSNRIIIALDGGRLIEATAGEIRNYRKGLSDNSDKADYYNKMYYKLTGKMLK